MGEDDDRPDCCFDEWAAANAERARRGGIAAPVTRAFVEELAAVGLDGRSVLDVGCGTGDLALAALDRGATRAHGIDLGEGAIGNARSLAADRGLADRATFEVGDGSTAPLPPADLVVLHRVVCCYPDATGLIDHTLAVAGDAFAFSAPIDRGVVGFWNRRLSWMENLWFGLRARKFRGFRTYIHDLDTIDRTIRAAGFTRRRHARSRVVWELAVYTR
ncbi:MAG TPA: methyltransferase domain-containing protein [Actinomycetota bacterium]|nr:methyltransferase domain-containing protein [Actinomycetota bacterium]